MRRRTLLVADDSPTVRKVVSLTFEDEGFRVVAVSTGAQALAELERESPDVLLADVHMPAPAGFELCARVKRDERTRRVPVVLLVGAFEPFDEAEARRSGADEVLTKPFQSIRDLVNKVGGLLGSQPEAPPADERAERERKEGAQAAGSERDTTDRTAEAKRIATAAAADAQAAAAAPPYSDLDMDDANIETVPAAEFETRQPARTRGFDARADAAAAADDTLLELGEMDATAAPAITPDDDFVLDFDDSITRAPSRAAGEPARDASAYEGSDYRATGASESAYVEPDYSESAFADDAPSAVEMQSAGSVSMAEPSAMWDTAPPFAVSPDAITAPVQAPAWEDSQVRARDFGGAPTTADDDDVHAAPATSGAHATGQQQGSAPLSPEAVETIARRVVELLSDRVVREVAWEVVPDLAERLIRQRLEEDRTRAK